MSQEPADAPSPAPADPETEPLPEGFTEDHRWLLRIPGVRRTLGLGDLVESVTRKVGIKPCAGCKKRKRLLNEKIVITGRKRRP